MRIARWPVVNVFAGEVVGVFAHVERADQHGAGSLQPLDQRGIARGRGKIAVDLRSGTRRQTLDVEQVLHGKRHTGERSRRFAGRDCGIDGARFFTRPFGGDVGKGIQGRIVFGDSRQRGFGGLESREFLVLDRVRDVERRHSVSGACHGIKL
jgi:hypothetical protein